MHTFF